MTSAPTLFFRGTHISFRILFLALFTLLSAPAAFAGVVELDTSFGTNGLVSTNFTGSSDFLFSLALDSDGNIVAGGATLTGIEGAPLLARYKPNGELDASFGTNGLVSVDFGGNDDWIASLALDSDGNIVVGGVCSSGDVKDFALARYKPSGELDASFGTDGLVSTDFGGNDDSISSLALDSDGNIVVGGSCSNGDAQHFALARYTPNGELDASFGTNGLVSTDFGGNDDWITSLALDSDGNIVVGGGCEDSGGGRDFALARYKPSGELDASFGTDGLVSTDFSGGEMLRSLAIDDDGNIVAGGGLIHPDGIDSILARYKPNGELDASFGTDGLVSTDFGNYDTIFSLAIDGNGNIVTGGTVTSTNGDDFALARYKPNGELDASFGTNGLVSTDFGGLDLLSSLAIDGNGHIVAGGSSLSGTWPPSFALARYTEASSADGCNVTALSGVMILLALPLTLLYSRF